MPSRNAPPKPSRPRQRDWVIEHEDDIQIGNDAELLLIVSRLPAADTISVSDIAAAINCSRSIVYAWIESGRFRVLDKGGTDKPLYYAFRNSLVDFLKTRIK